MGVGIKSREPNASSLRVLSIERNTTRRSSITPCWSHFYRIGPHVLKHTFLEIKEILSYFYKKNISSRLLNNSF